MKLSYPQIVLQKELERINQPVDEDDDDDYIGSVANYRASIQLKKAIKLLAKCEEINKLINS